MIAILIDSIERYHFFSRMIRALQEKYSIVIITADPLAYFLSKSFGCERILIKRTKKNLKDKCYLDNFEENVNFSIDMLNGYYSKDNAKSYYSSSIVEIDAFFYKNNISKCVIWNGQKLLAKAAVAVCKKYTIQTVFLEISNLPNKMFSDIKGVNAASRLYSDINIIDEMPPVPDSKHLEWMLDYENSKNKKLPQSQTKIRKKIYQFINYLLKLDSRFFRGRFRLGNIRNSINLSHVVDKNFSILDGSYLFLALQVSSDTQIKLNSSFNNTDSIAYAVNRAKELGKRLVVKIHPAENDKQEILKILEKRKEFNFFITEMNTVKLIKHADEVIVINSTVGLEALFYNKKIIVLGRAFYSFFDQERLKKYVHHYLIDGIDYFSDEEIPLSLCEKLLLIKNNPSDSVGFRE